VVLRRVSWFSFFAPSVFGFLLTFVFHRLIGRRQDLEHRARERYDTLDCLDAELD
jgi:hypothetical protein